MALENVGKKRGEEKGFYGPKQKDQAILNNASAKDINTIHTEK